MVLRYAVCRLVITLKPSLGDGQCHAVIPKSGGGIVNGKQVIYGFFFIMGILLFFFIPSGLVKATFKIGMGILLGIGWEKWLIGGGGGGGLMGGLRYLWRALEPSPVPYPLPIARGKMVDYFENVIHTV